MCKRLSCIQRWRPIPVGLEPLLDIIIGAKIDSSLDERELSGSVNIRFLW